LNMQGRRECRRRTERKHYPPRSSARRAEENTGLTARKCEVVCHVGARRTIINRRRRRSCCRPAAIHVEQSTCRPQRPRWCRRPQHATPERNEMCARRQVGGVRVSAAQPVVGQAAGMVVTWWRVIGSGRRASVRGFIMVGRVAARCRSMRVYPSRVRRCHIRRRRAATTNAVSVYRIAASAK